MAITDAQARNVMKLAVAKRGLTVGIAALQIMQAIARHETGYGVLLGEEHHNWGAIICLHGPPCGEGCFESGDKDASGTSYRACRRHYPNDIEGAADMVRELYRRPHVAAALTAGDVLGTATAMATPAHGIGAYHQTQPVLYATAVYRHVREISAALREPIFAQWSQSAPQQNPQPQLSPHPPQPKSGDVWPWMLGFTALLVATHAGARRLKKRHYRGTRS